ncbi:SH3-domain-containing protein [Peniophora sp. CONT]|nr:SH3-domain-containing protein [Peniophora sp. CONT]
MSDNILRIVYETRQNVEHLMAQGELSRSDGNVILNRLPTVSDISVRGLTDGTRRLGLSGNSTSVSRMPTASHRRSVSPPPPPPAPARRTQPAKALWSYNEDGAEANDLSFREGDIIVITEQTNADWWTGSHNGREGLFPASYVEKISRASSPARAPAPAPTSRAVAPAAPQPSQNSGYASTPPPNSGYCAPPPNPGYAGPPPPNPGYSAPPAPGYGPPPPQSYGPPPPQSYGPPGQYQPYPQQYPPPPPPATVVIVETAPQQQSGGGFGGGGGGGGFGSLFASSAVGGLGFGLGSAVAENIVDDIFD